MEWRTMGISFFVLRRFLPRSNACGFEWYGKANKIQLLAHKIDVQQHVIRDIDTQRWNGMEWAKEWNWKWLNGCEWMCLLMLCHKQRRWCHAITGFTLLFIRTNSLACIFNTPLTPHHAFPVGACHFGWVRHHICIAPKRKKVPPLIWQQTKARVCQHLA